MLRKRIPSQRVLFLKRRDAEEQSREAERKLHDSLSAPLQLCVSKKNVLKPPETGLAVK